MLLEEHHCSVTRYYSSSLKRNSIAHGGSFQYNNRTLSRFTSIGFTPLEGVLLYIHIMRRLDWCCRYSHGGLFIRFAGFAVPTDISQSSLLQFYNLFLVRFVTSCSVRVELL